MKTVRTHSFSPSVVHAAEEFLKDVFNHTFDYLEKITAENESAFVEMMDNARTAAMLDSERDVNEPSETKVEDLINEDTER